MQKNSIEYIFEQVSSECENSRQMKHFFLEKLSAAEFHWFFVQAVGAIENELYLPAISSLLNGIEASLRVTVAQLESNIIIEQLSPYQVLSNTLINKALELGMPIESLAFQEENDFMEKLGSQKPNRIDVEIVRVRNNICHGNIFQYINKKLGEQNYFFVPDLLIPLTNSVLDVSINWTNALGQFRREKGFLHYD